MKSVWIEIDRGIWHDFLEEVRNIIWQAAPLYQPMRPIVEGINEQMFKEEPL